MKRSKRAVALLLAWAMVLTLVWGSGSLALAGELDDAAAEQSVVTEQEDAAQAQTEPAEESTPAEEFAPGEESVESRQEPSAPVQEEPSEEPAELPPVEGEAETPAQAQEAPEQTRETDPEPLEDAEASEQASEPESEQDAESAGGLEPQSLLPLPEKKAYLRLSDYTREELRRFSVSDLLDLLEDANGNPFEFPAAETIWRYTRGEEGLEQYEAYSILYGDVMDLCPEEDVEEYRMELIIGRDGQLCKGNVRYLVTVYCTDAISQEVEFQLWMEDEAGRRCTVPFTNRNVSESTVMGAPLTTVQYTVPGHSSQSRYYLGIDSRASQHPGLDVYVNTFSSFVTGYNAKNLGLACINERILNQELSQPDTGWEGSYDTASGLSLSEYFVISFVERGTGNEVLRQFALVSVRDAGQDSEVLTGSLYDQVGGEMQDVVCRQVDSVEIARLDACEVERDPQTGRLVGKVKGMMNHFLCIMLREGVSARTEHSCVLRTLSDNHNGNVRKVVLGRYGSEEDAEGREDIKDRLLPDDLNAVPRGFPANYSGDGQYFTVFYDSGQIDQYNVTAIDYDRRFDPSYIRQLTQAPVVGQQDPWLRITGARQDGTGLDGYVVENGKSINLDTMYGYGYQTLLLNDQTADLSRIQPELWLADPERMEVWVDGQRLREGDTVDFSGGPVQFTLKFQDHVKNYQVQVVKKRRGSALFVNGPTTQEVFLDEYFEYKHDILIANLGTEPLEDLNVSLQATHCRLDDYWTLGGQNNRLLGSFSTTQHSTEHGEPGNVAKIRLLPDGEGEIEGTLTIIARNQAPVVLTLTGRAQNPKVTTARLSKGVKYVPYSHLITTNNMYDWTDVRFSVEGRLPRGVELIESTGELYGVPLEAGTFPLEVTARFTSETYSFEASTVHLNLEIEENTDENVFAASDRDYVIVQPIGVDEGNHSYVLEEYEDVLFWSQGELAEFVDLWLNGERLTRGVDYDAEHGSTKVTLRKQTLDQKAKRNESNTIAAEFRTSDTHQKNDKNDGNKLKRTAQNFKIKPKKQTVCNHKWDSGTVTRQPTYTAAGVRTVTCTRCGKKNTVSIPKLSKVDNEIRVSKAFKRTANAARPQSFHLGASANGAALSYKSGNKNVSVKNGKVTISKGFSGKVTIKITAAATDKYKAAQKSVTVTVHPSVTRLSGAKWDAKKKVANISWKKNATGKGYEIQVSPQKSFKKAAKRAVIRKNAAVRTAVTGLKPGTYYVRIRTVNGRIYSAWSRVRTLKIAK